MSIEDARKRREAPLDTPSNLGSNATKDISAALTVLLADVFALYVKTKNFHWHISGPHSGNITSFLTSKLRRFSR
jgi:starvation-inducible DNA-binding protein